LAPYWVRGDGERMRPVGKPCGIETECPAYIGAAGAPRKDVTNVLPVRAVGPAGVGYAIDRKAQASDRRKVINCPSHKKCVAAIGAARCAGRVESNSYRTIRREAGDDKGIGNGCLLPIG